MADVAGKRSRQVDLSVGLEILDGFLRGLLRARGGERRAAVERSVASRVSGRSSAHGP